MTLVIYESAFKRLTLMRYRLRWKSDECGDEMQERDFTSRQAAAEFAGCRSQAFQNVNRAKGFMTSRNNPGMKIYGARMLGPDERYYASLV